MNKDKTSSMVEMVQKISSLLNEFHIYWGDIDLKPEESKEKPLNWCELVDKRFDSVDEVNKEQQLSISSMLERLEAVEKRLVPVNLINNEGKLISPTPTSVAPTSPLTPFGVEVEFEKWWKNYNPPIGESVKDLTKDAFYAGYRLSEQPQNTPQ